MRIGAVNYLNSKPLIYGLDRLAPEATLSCDLPSRLADSLAAGRLDVALIPSIELLRRPDYDIVSDACVACLGPVLSVKLHFRVPPAATKRLALDEGSRTSAALAQILLQKLVGVSPDCEPLPIGCGLNDTDADAVLLIGDRAMVSNEQGARSGEQGTESEETPCSPFAAPRSFVEVWDLGERWYDWTGLPFVFAMWVARRDAGARELATLLTAARDEGVAHLAEVAAREAPSLGIPIGLATRYLRDNLHFAITDPELRGLRRFSELCSERGLLPDDINRSLEHLTAHGCTTQ